MVKLSEQILKRQPEARQTRTARVRSTQEAQREERNFKNLKEKAESIKQREFSNVTTITEYERKYKTLPSNVKPFFTTPSHLKSNQQDRIQTNIQTVNEQITQTQNDKNTAFGEYQADLSRLGLLRHQRPERADFYRTKIRERRDKWQEKEQFFKAKIGGLKQGLSNLQSGQDLDVTDIKQFAQTKGFQAKQIEQSRNESSFKQREQTAQIKRLQEQGFTPTLKQHFKDDKLQSESIDFFNAKTGEFSNLVVPLSKPVKDISGLRKAETIKTAKLNREIQIGKQSYQFETNPQLFKTETGHLTTQFSSDETARTETQIINDAYRQAYQDFLKENPPVDVKYDKKTETEQKTSTVDNFQLKTQTGLKAIANLINKNFYLKIDKKKSLIPKIPDLEIDFGLKDKERLKQESIETMFLQPARVELKSDLKMAGNTIASAVVPTYNFLRKHIFFTTKDPFLVAPRSNPLPNLNNMIGIPQVSLAIGSATAPKDVEETFGGRIVRSQAQQQTIAQKELERQIGIDKLTSFEEEKEEQGQKDVTSLFYRSKFGVDAFFKQSDEEQTELAFGKYKETDEYKAYSKQYQKDYDKDFTKLKQDVPYLTKLEGVVPDVKKLVADNVSMAEKSRILQVSSAGVKYVGLGVEQSALKVFQSPVNIALVGGAVYTGSVVLKSVPALPVVLDTTLILKGASDTFSPSSSFEKRASGSVMLGLGATSLSLKGIHGIKSLNKSIFRQEVVKAPYPSKLSTDIIGVDKGGVIKYGKQERLYLSTAGRKTVVTTKWRDMLGFDPSIYRGIPTKQLGKTYVYESLRSTTTIKTPSGYEKAFKILVESMGKTTAEARDILRYTAPKVKVQSLISATAGVKDGVININALSKIEQPVINFNDIKTRGAKTVYSAQTIQRPVIIIDGKEVVLQKSQLLSATRTKAGMKAILRGDMGVVRGGSFGEQELIIKGQKALMEKIRSFSATKRTFPIKSNIINIDGNQAIILKNVLQETQKSNLLLPAQITKTPFSKTFGSFGSKAEIKKLIGALDKKIGTGMPQIISTKTGTGTQQIFAGKEALTTKEVLNMGFDLPSVNVQSVSVIKDLINIGDLTKMGVGVDLGSSVISASALSQGNVFAQRNTPKPLFKTSTALRDLLKDDEVLKNLTDSTYKQTSVNKSITKTVSINKLINQLISVPSIPSTTPVFRQPVFRVPPPPKIPTIAIPFLLGKPRKTTSTKQTKQIKQLLFLPDFTSRALGLPAQTITEKQAQAKLKKILTGLEIRRGVKVKF